MDTQKLMTSGAIAGVATPYLLQYVVMPILNFFGGFIPAVNIKLADSVAINIRESLTGIQAGMAGWLTDALGVTVPANMFASLVMSAVGGALLFIAGAYIAEMFGLLKGNALQKTKAVIFTGSVAAALLLGTIGLPVELGLNLLNLLIAFGINAAILAWLYELIDAKAKIGLVPF